MGSDGEASVRLGSGHEGQQLDAVLCANATSHGCRNGASKVCQNCRLVAYCSKECQKEHWKLHKQLCKSPIMEDSWLPSWIRDARPPSFYAPGKNAPMFCDVSPEITQSQPFQGEWLWGNFPAYGLLGSKSTLPDDASQDDEICFCFAASGDLRNVIETVCQIPDGFKGKATVYVNDHNSKVMLRNFLMLELLRVHGAHAIDAVIALWYSIALTSSQITAVRALAREMKSWDHSEDEIYRYSTCFCSSMPECLVAQFSKSVMETLELLYKNDISLDAAKEMRKLVIMSRPDLGERRMGCLQPAHRLVWNHFRDTGLLLPFGSRRLAAYHDMTNQFLFTPFVGWTLGDGADPLNGWDTKQMKMTGMSCGVPSNDLYGCLFFHLRAKLQLFLAKWRLGRVRLILTDADASNLARDLRQKGVRLHRVDTSNLVDMHYMGIKKVMKDWGPLLHPGTNNLVVPIIITYFLNWALHYNCFMEERGKKLADPAVTKEEVMLGCRRGCTWGKMKKGFPELVKRLTMSGDTSWYTYFHDFSKAFDEYLGMHRALEVAQTLGLQRARKHCIVPHRLFVSVSATSSATLPLSMEDFYEHNCIGYNHTMTERLVEWKRMESKLKT